jgi:hypothetical protein
VRGEKPFEVEGHGGRRLEVRRAGEGQRRRRGGGGGGGGRCGGFDGKNRAGRLVGWVRGPSDRGRRARPSGRFGFRQTAATVSLGLGLEA